MYICAMRRPRVILKQKKTGCPPVCSSALMFYQFRHRRSVGGGGERQEEVREGK